MEQAIISQWKEANNNSGDAKSTFKSYKAWLKILDECEKCKCINSGPYKYEAPIEMETIRNFQTARAQNAANLEAFNTKAIQERINIQNTPACSVNNTRREVPQIIQVIRRTTSIRNEKKKKKHPLKIARYLSAEEIANKRRNGISSNNESNNENLDTSE